MNKRVYIVIVNWNGWRDTIECLESVLRNGYSNYRIIICDNDSQDNSLEQIKNWAEGRITVSASSDAKLPLLSNPPIPKPVSFVMYNRTQAEAGGDAADDGSSSLVLVQTGGNLGFAGGNNVGIRYALARQDFGYVWLLNNDTVVEADALVQLVDRINQDPQAGMCGSTMPYYSVPDKLWAAGGGTFNKWTGNSRHVGLMEQTQLYTQNLVSEAAVEQKMNYIAGASLLVTLEFLTKVGLMCEDYFLYFEELDWAMRARNKFRLVYAGKSVVYHKVGVSTESERAKKLRSPMGGYFLSSRLKFTRKFFPYTLPILYGQVFLHGIKKLIGSK